MGAATTPAAIMEARNAEVIRLYRETNLTQAQIGVMVGLTQGRVSHVLRSQGVIHGRSLRHARAAHQ